MTKTVLGAIAAALLLQATALAQTTVTLAPVNTSGPAGSATLSEQNGGLMVSLKLPQSYQPARAAVFSGTCRNKTSGPISPEEPISLNVNATGGEANTILQSVSLQELTSKPHVIVVLGKPALCGDIAAVVPQKP